MSLDLTVLLQLTAGGVCLAGVFALLGLSWAVIFNTTRVFHVAHGVTLAVGGYIAVQLANDAGVPWPVAVAAATVGGALLGVVFQELLYEPLRRRGVDKMVTFVGSLGAMLACLAVLLAIYGANPRILSGPLDAVLKSGSVRLTLAQVVSGAIGGATVIAFVVLWRTTWFGRALRAVISNPDMATAVGIKVRRQHLIAMTVGSALGGLAGALLALSQGASQDTALNGVLLAAIAVLVGGIGSVPGAAIGGVLLALAMNIGIWPISSKWQYTVAFGVLMLVLLFRPRGLFGERLAQADL
jgi:branched-chain amino acid transport system permease protein